MIKSDPPLRWLSPVQAQSSRFVFVPVDTCCVFVFVATYCLYSTWLNVRCFNSWINETSYCIICCSLISTIKFVIFGSLFVFQSQQLVLSSVHRSVSPTFLPNLLSLWRITGSREMNPDSTAGDERQTFTFVFIRVISPSHTPIVTLLHGLCLFLFSPDSVLSASSTLSPLPFSGLAETDNHLSSAMPRTRRQHNCR